MVDIYALLDIKQESLNDFSLLANRIDNMQIERTINRNIRQLEEIESRAFTDEGIRASPTSIDDIIGEVVEVAHSGQNDKQEKWTTHDLRIVSYYMMKLADDDQAYNFALSLLENRWKNLFFNGLTFYILNSWHQINPKLRQKTCQLIVNELQNYTGSNRRYLTLKNHANYFDDAGPMRLAALLFVKKISLWESPAVLGGKPADIAKSFYSDVIVAYCDKANADLDLIEKIFEIHQHTRTKKLVLADAVIRADKGADAIKQAQLSRFINRILGDVTIGATWAPFEGASDEERQKLKQARHLANLWFTRRIIETFFEICVQDRDRKKFWLDYVQYVSRFKIVGSNMTKHALQNDPRIGSMVNRHFIETRSSYSQTSALILCIRQKVIIEFSDTGALYVYNKDHNKIRFLRDGSSQISSTNELKLTSMDMLIENYDWYHHYNDEGRMTHQGYWQDRLEGWMRDKIFSKEDSEDFVCDDEFERPVITQGHLQEQAKQQVPKTEPLFQKGKIEIPTPKTSTDKLDWTDNQRQMADATSSKYAEDEYLGQISPETGIIFTKCSKWIFDNTCRVGCNRKGFYLNIVKERHFYFLREMFEGTLALGNVWIKKTTSGEWLQIVYSYNGKELSVGYVKQNKSVVYFKQDYSSNGYKVI